MAERKCTVLHRGGKFSDVKVPNACGTNSQRMVNVVADGAPATNQTVTGSIPERNNNDSYDSDIRH